MVTPSAERVAVEQAAAAFAAELSRWRVERGLTKKHLAAEMGFDPSYVSHVEAGRHRPTEDFARRAEAALGSRGAIWRRFRQYEDLRLSASRTRSGMPVRGIVPARDPGVADPWLPPGAGVVVEEESAALSYDAGTYRVTVRRALYNAGTEPVTRYPIRVDVDRFPDEPQRSNQHYRESPLTSEELGLRAYCDGELMAWHAKVDHDSFKEIWLRFENREARFPLYPGQRAIVEYTYSVGDEKWGPWFQRAVRMPTRLLSMRLDFPATAAPVVWGVETSLTAEAVPLRTPITQRSDGERVVFTWSTEAPSLHARYRLEWRFRADRSADRAADDPPPAGDPASDSPGDPQQSGDTHAATEQPTEQPTEQSAESTNGGAVTELARASGVLSRLELPATAATTFDLPREREEARMVVNRLRITLRRLTDLAPTVGAVGLSAPLLGLTRAALLVLPAGHAEPTVLLNPRVLDASNQVTEEYESCLAVHDVCGRVVRPVRIEVEHSTETGTRVVSVFERTAARLVAHEIDHLQGRLYLDRMPAGAPLVPWTERSGQATD